MRTTLKNSIFLLCFGLYACGGDPSGTSGTILSTAGTTDTAIKVTFLQTATLSIVEEAKSFQVTATLEKALDQDLIVSLSAVDVSTDGGSDYVIPQEIVFTAGQTGVNFEVELIDDMGKESMEAFYITAGVNQPDVESSNRFVVNIEPSDEVIYVYFTQNYTADFGGRSGADALCKNNAPTGIQAQSHHAILAFDPDDHIANIKTTFGLTGAEGVKDAAGSSAFASLDLMLQGGAPEVAVAFMQLSGSPSYSSFWTGGNPATPTTQVNCNGFTSNSSGSYGAVGLITGSGVDYYNLSSNCAQGMPILCMAN